MVPELRQAYNDAFTPESYERVLAFVENRAGVAAGPEVIRAPVRPGATLGSARGLRNRADAERIQPDRDVG